MKRILSLIISGTFLTVCATGGAFAQTTAPTTQAPAANTDGAASTTTAPSGNKATLPARIDTNQDNAIEQSEFTNTDRLKKFDTNGDGTLSPDEIEAMALKRLAAPVARRITRRLDVNGDGKVTIAEVEKQKAERFALLDRNGDGKLDRSELRRIHKGQHHRAEKHHNNHHGKKHTHNN
jgi:hypothetical protein